MNVSSEQLVSCDNCVGACCRARTQLELNRREVRFMKAGGNKLIKIHEIIDKTQVVEVQIDTGRRRLEQGVLCKVVKVERVTLTGGYGLFMLENDCAYLDGGEGSPKCKVYDNKPGICNEFEEGGPGCLAGRKIMHERGTFPEWQPIELTLKQQS
jgi:Fe-S-cluster containining protein